MSANRACRPTRPAPRSASTRSRRPSVHRSCIGRRSAAAPSSSSAMRPSQRGRRATWPAAGSASAADFPNYKRRTEQEREASCRPAPTSRCCARCSAIADDFDRAIEAMPEPTRPASAWVRGHRGHRPQAAHAARVGGRHADRGARASRSTRAQHEAVSHIETDRRARRDRRRRAPARLPGPRPGPAAGARRRRRTQHPTSLHHRPTDPAHATPPDRPARPGSGGND